ncbi:unnamed protein product [Blepharisma stoltei]|uniref:Uncharacterized protein n=1 Tax=Blepharisma stoltei TaxID=1481888 RepID=A0AAU9ISJ2_9CILI|nr:unnamed protein product [Blepharisma stoltei]
MIPQINQERYFHNKDRILFEKYMQAEDVRQFKPIGHSLIKQMQIEPAVNLIKNTRKIEILESKLLEEWKFKEEQRLRRMKKIDQEKDHDYGLLYQRVIRDSARQEAKLIRKSLPMGPKVDPLPYLKKTREALCNSLSLESEEEIINEKSTPDPGFVYLYPHEQIKKGIGFKIGNKTKIKSKSKSPSPVSSKTPSKLIKASIYHKANTSIDSPFNFKLLLK